MRDLLLSAGALLRWSAWGGEGPHRCRPVMGGRSNPYGSPVAAGPLGKAKVASTRSQGSNDGEPWPFLTAREIKEAPGTAKPGGLI